MDGPIQVNLPSVDWTQLIPELVGLFFAALGTWLQAAMHATFDAAWGSDANVIGTTPLAMTWQFGPVQAQLTDIQTGARAVLLFAVILLGVRGMLGAIVAYQPNLAGEFVNGVIGAVVLLAAFPLVVPLCINLVNQAAHAVASGAGISAYLGSAGGIDNPLISAVLLVILLFFALRLLIKAVWRIGFLAVLLPVGAVACACYALPQLRWLIGWWARTWGGMLAAQIPSVFALAIGAGLFAGGGGIGPFVYSIAFLQLATDLYSLIPFGFPGGSGGAPWGGLPWRGAQVALTGGAAAPAAAGMGAAAASASMRPQLLADQYGYR
jgi:hypothetical protein